MALKKYNQSCALAAALDVIGDRWSWLILRGLFCGPARFGDLMHQLPGIGSNLLAARLKQLAGDGVIRKRGEGKQSAYELSDKGETLRKISYGLARWGRTFEPAENAKSMPQWSMFNLEASFLEENAQGLEAVVEFTLADYTWHAVIRHGVCRSRSGPAIAPDVTIHSPHPNLLGSKTRLRIEGDPEVFARLQQCFDLRS